MDDPLSKADLAALQGVWEQVRVEVDGVCDPPDEYSALGTLTTISGHHFSVRAPDGALLLEGVFELDASRAPKHVNWIDSMGPDAGRSLPAIYELNGDHFVFIAGDTDAPRPSVFRTAMGQTMRSFVRTR